MSGLATTLVPPARDRGETRVVALVAVAIVAAWALVLALRPPPPATPPLRAHQASVFTTLTPVEQGLFNDLQAAAAEIRALQRETSTWPAPEELHAQAIPPFAEDAAWVRRGRQSWTKLDAHAADHAIYWARSPAGAGLEWALVLSGTTTSVWRRTAAPDAPPPAALLPVLILDGWQELVALTPPSS